MRRIRSFGLTAGLVGAALSPLASGCAEPAFSAHARDNSVEDIQRTLAAEGTQAPKRTPTAYLVTAGEKHLVAYDLQAGSAKWDHAADVTSRLAVGRGFVAHRVGRDANPKTGEAERAQSVVVRSAQTGNEICRAPLKHGEQFLGLAADDRVYYVVQTLTGETRVSALVAISPETCSELWRDQASGSIGAPAARGGLVAVPYAFQNVVLVDGKTGVEASRVRATDEAVNFVRATPEGLFYGDNKGVYLLDQKSAAGSKKGSSYVEAHLASSQIRTFFYWDAYQPSQADYTAFDKNRLLWRAQPSANEGGITFRDDAAILHNYRFLFAFDAKGGDIRWAYAHPKVDLAGSDDTGPSIVFASVDGELGALDARTGAKVWSAKTGLKVAGATFDADGFAPAGEKGETQPVLKTLNDIVSDHDARFIAVKVFAVTAMTRVPGIEATRQLIDVVTKDGIAPPVAKAAGEALLARKDASAKQLYRDALAVHADYLNDRRTHGVDVLARVVAAVGDTEAAPLLARHLADPATPLPALKEIVRSLISLGGNDSVAALRNLLLTYRSDPGFVQDPVPLQLAADGLLRLAGAEGRRTVLFVGEEARTLPALSSYIHRALAAPGAPLPDTGASSAPRAAAEKAPVTLGQK